MTSQSIIIITGRDISNDNFVRPSSDSVASKALKTTRLYKSIYYFIIKAMYFFDVYINISNGVVVWCPGGFYTLGPGTKESLATN